MLGHTETLLAAMRHLITNESCAPIFSHRKGRPGVNLHAVRRNYDQVRKESLIVKRREVEREQNAAVRRARYPTCRNPSGGVGGSGQGPLHRKTHCTRSTLLLSAGSLTPLKSIFIICKRPQFARDPHRSGKYITRSSAETRRQVRCAQSRVSPPRSLLRAQLGRRALICAASWSAPR